MQLDWVPDYSENKLTLEIDNIKYITLDGGQNIDKYIEGEFNKRIRQFPEQADDWLQPHMETPLNASLDEWCAELDWLIETYPDIVGQRHLVLTYREKDGSITNTEHVRGQGANNLEDLISVNRIGIPASVQERWDWTELAVSYTPIENAPMGLAWSEHKETGQIIRHGHNQNCPCHVFPQIYKPVTIEKENLTEDITSFGGQYL